MISVMAVFKPALKCKDHILIFCYSDQQIPYLSGYLWASNQSHGSDKKKKKRSTKSWVGRAHATGNYSFLPRAGVSKVGIPWQINESRWANIENLHGIFLHVNYECIVTHCGKGTQGHKDNKEI